MEKIEEKELPRELPAGIKDKFECIGILPGVVIYKTQKIDLRKIPLSKAEELANDENFRYLVRKDKAPKAEIPAKSEGAKAAKDKS